MTGSDLTHMCKMNIGLEKVPLLWETLDVVSVHTSLRPWRGLFSPTSNIWQMARWILCSLLHLPAAQVTGTPGYCRGEVKGAEVDCHLSVWTTNYRTSIPHYGRLCSHHYICMRSFKELCLSQSNWSQTTIQTTERWLKVQICSSST